MQTSGSTEISLPTAGRIYVQTRRPLLSDCAPSGRLRLDALAGWLQDIAYLDVEDAGVAHLAVWVVRRTTVLVKRWPRFGETHPVRTFCSGLGKMWAERRTVVGADADVETVSLWVHLDPVSRRPAPLTEDEVATYAEAAVGRRVTARLRHPAPPPSRHGRAWTFRAVDCDIADHINNTAYWQTLEEELLADPHEPERFEAEIEFRTPAQPGRMTVVTLGRTRWIVGPDGTTHASIVVCGVGASGAVGGGQPV